MTNSHKYYSSRYKLLSLNNTRSRIGLLGGSFNPPHQGHVHISLEAIKRFNLSYIIWLVTPCNPFKNSKMYAPLHERVDASTNITKPYSKRIKIIDIEKFFRNTYSSNTVQRIAAMHPNTNFYWIMGGDNIFHIHLWFMWQKVFKKNHVAVCERNSASLKIMNTKVANILNCNHIDHSLTHKKNKSIKNEFFMVHTRKIDISSTEIRRKIQTN